MLLITGTYNFAKRPTIYRNDYCLTCEAERVARQFRSFDAFHLYYIPVIPLGFRRHWTCTRCARDPRARTRTAKAPIVILSVLCALIAIGVWSAPISSPADAQMFWAMRALFTIAPIGLVFLIKSLKPPIDRKEMLKAIQPLRADICYFCAGALDSRGFCSNCGIQLDQESTNVQQPAEPYVAPWIRK